MAILLNNIAIILFKNIAEILEINKKNVFIIKFYYELKRNYELYFITVQIILICIWIVITL